MKKFVLILSIILMLIFVSIVQVSANQDNKNVGKIIQNQEPTKELVWKGALCLFSLKLKNETRIDYLFKNPLGGGITLILVKISGFLRNTSDINTVFGDSYGFTSDKEWEEYEIRMLQLSINGLDIEITGKPYIVPPPGRILWGSGWFVKIYK